MKLHYTKILLFFFPLNVLLTSYHANNNKNKPSITQRHTPRYTSRVLSECDLYMSSNDNDPDMKSVKKNFDRQTSQRLREYDERLQDKRQKCKEQCDKDIQKIILKDKLEKQMAQQLTTLETKIDTNDIPTCICEKTMADKTEKFCLNCGVNVGGGVTLSSGVLGGIGAVAVNAWKDAALEAAIDFATKAGAAKGLAEGNAHGMKIVISFLKQWGVDELIPEIYKTFVATNRYADVTTIAGDIIKKHGLNCADSLLKNPAMCKKIGIQFGLTNPKTLGPIGRPAPQAIPKMISGLVEQADLAAKTVAKNTAKEVTAEITEQQTALIESGFNSSITSINASIVAIVVIVLIMVIIYLILRYRRKKKMKKKLQYIKLLDE
ncbi:hypothetical protein PFAG_00305 [Plasmodium falciparum Santa Lucia]|uniref:Surface antigen n=2 Tax=Plasmodium falciparum TaxID=5833 RepID=W7GBW0_PLAFA|nr:hypothetical protein PFAG_00305 [Plasmodium falciparum Santa Lucia]